MIQYYPEMKKLLFILQFPLFVFFNISLFLGIIQLADNTIEIQDSNGIVPVYNGKEDFDPSLQRINSIRKLESFSDSLYNSKYNQATDSQYEHNYAEVVTETVRNRFYHGYSKYTMSNNFVASLFSKASLDGYSAIIIPDDIMKYPYAACSQQAIVVMELLRKKGLTTRKVGFQGKISGHFCFEVFYNGGWHFYDTNMEPDVAVLNAHNRPSINVLAANKELLLNAYRSYPEELVTDIFLNYSFGKPNRFPAPRGIVFQQLAKFLSYTAWLFFLAAFIIVRIKYLKLRNNKYVWNRRVSFPQPKPATSPSYYRGITAPGA
jgi:hypothetical protein